MSDGFFSIWTADSLLPLPPKPPSVEAQERFDSCQFRSEFKQKIVTKLCCGNSNSEEGFRCSQLEQFISADICGECVYYKKK